MAAVTEKKLRESIKEILKDSDLSALSAKKVRQQLEEEYECDLTHRKKQIDEILMEMVNAAENGEGSPKAKKSKREDSSDEEDSDDEPKKGGKKKAAKKPAAATGGSGKKATGYMKPCKLSPQLCKILNVPTGEKMVRSEIVKKMWAYVKENDLQDPSNKQFMIPDEKLRPIFGTGSVRTFGMMKFLKSHIFTDTD